MEAQAITNPFELIDNRLKSIEESLAQIVASKAPESEKKFYAIADAAKKLGVAPITIYRNVQSGKIPSKKVGQRVMIPGSYVDSLL